MTSPSSFNVTGLLSGAAGSIDTTSLISQLMQVAALPQTQLKNQLSVQQAYVSAYQTISSKVSAMQTAAEALTDSTAWTATTATSSNAAVVATSTGAASTGSTTFDVLAVAAAQVSVVAADSGGNVTTNPSAGITITGSDGAAHQINISSGSATDVAAAINAADVGVRAAVVTTDSGAVLQMTAASTGTDASFTASGFSSPVSTLVPAANAKIGVGDPTAGGYTVSSPTNTFTGVIPGVTFTVAAQTTGVTVTVDKDEQSISDKVATLVDAVNAATSAITNQTGNGAILQGFSDVIGLQQAMLSAVSQTAGNTSLKTYGIDMDNNGVLSFDAGAFAAAYAADPSGTNSVIGGFASSLDGVATGAIAPATGSISVAIDQANGQEDTLNKQITDWTGRLSTMQATLQAKYTAMETALAKLSSQQTYLDNMFKSIDNSSNSSSSSS